MFPLMSVLQLPAGWRVEVEMESLPRSIPSSSNSRTIAISAFKEGETKPAASTVVSWAEICDPQVSWNEVEETLELRGERKIVKLPLKLARGLAQRVGSKKLAGGRIINLNNKFLPVPIKKDESETKTLEEWMEILDIQTFSNKFLNDVYKFLDEAGFDEVSPANQQKILNLCRKQECKVKLFEKFVRSGLFFDNRVREELLEVVVEKNEPNLWLSVLQGEMVSEAFLAETVKACVREIRKNEEWVKVFEKVLEKRFTNQRLVDELRYRVSPEEALCILTLLREKLGSLFSGDRNSVKFNKVVDWTCAVIDAHGGSLLTDQNFVQRLDETSEMVKDMVLLLDSGKEFVNKINVSKRIKEDIKKSSDQKYAVERIFI